MRDFVADIKQVHKEMIKNDPELMRQERIRKWNLEEAKLKKILKKTV